MASLSSLSSTSKQDDSFVVGGKRHHVSDNDGDDAVTVEKKMKLDTGSTPELEKEPEEQCSQALFETKFCLPQATIMFQSLFIRYTYSTSWYGLFKYFKTNFSENMSTMDNSKWNRSIQDQIETEDMTPAWAWVNICRLFLNDSSTEKFERESVLKEMFHILRQSRGFDVSVVNDKDDKRNLLFVSYAASVPFAFSLLLGFDSVKKNINPCSLIWMHFVEALFLKNDDVASGYVDLLWKSNADETFFNSQICDENHPSYCPLTDEASSCNTFSALVFAYDFNMVQTVLKLVSLRPIVNLEICEIEKHVVARIRHNDRWFSDKVSGTIFNVTYKIDGQSRVISNKNVHLPKFPLFHRIRRDVESSNPKTILMVQSILYALHDSKEYLSKSEEATRYVLQFLPIEIIELIVLVAFSEDADSDLAQSATDVDIEEESDTD